MFFDRGPDSETPRNKTVWVDALREKGEVVALLTLLCTVLCTTRICPSTDPRRYCTVSVVEPEIPSRLAEMFAVPFPVENAIPLRVTTAIAGFDVVHCTYGVAI